MGLVQIREFDRIKTARGEGPSQELSAPRTAREIPVGGLPKNAEIP